MDPAGFVDVFRGLDLPNVQAVTGCVLLALFLVGFGVVKPRKGRRSRRRRNVGAGRLVSWLWGHRPGQSQPHRQYWLYVHHPSPARLAQFCVTLPRGREHLYAGYTNSASDRSDQHGENARSKSPWIHLVGWIELIPLPPGTTKAQALAAEKRLIHERRPLCNQADNPYLHWPTLNRCRQIDRSVRFGDHSTPPLATTRDRLAVVSARARRSLIPLAGGAALALAAPRLFPVVLAFTGR